MTSVSFYKLSGDLQVALALVCQLTQKAINANQQVLCLVPDQDTAQQLDKLLWDFQASAFVPHGLGTEHRPIAISADNSDPGEHHGILINLQGPIPTWFSRFERVMEVIYPEPDYEQTKRDNFKFYKERGYSLSFHDLTEKFKP
ncbi:DNA polymerase III subunit chi [Porticoccaceae bacterium]|nr:DNA polymerase III subunit chi [Porticoccaceae bacterium]